MRRTQIRKFTPLFSSRELKESISRDVQSHPWPTSFCVFLFSGPPSLTLFSKPCNSSLFWSSVLPTQERSAQRKKLMKFPFETPEPSLPSSFHLITASPQGVFTGGGRGVFTGLSWCVCEHFTSLTTKNVDFTFLRSVFYTLTLISCLPGCSLTASVSKMMLPCRGNAAESS